MNSSSRVAHAKPRRNNSLATGGDSTGSARTFPGRGRRWTALKPTKLSDCNKYARTGTDTTFNALMMPV
eukprot:3988720-Lingulodinium_polyedra.AAC.1